MNGSKRVISFLLCFFLFFSLAACGQKAADTPATTAPSTTAAPVTEYAEEKALLLQHWKDYMLAINNIYDHMNWALNYMEVYAENGDWDSYLKASAACSAALRYVGGHNYNLLYTLTDEVTQALNSIDIETETVQTYYLAFESTQQECSGTLKGLLNDLLFSVYYLPLQEQFIKEVRSNQEQLSLMSSYYCLTTNYLLLTLGQDSDWDTFFADLPILAAAKGAWISDQTALEDECNGVLDRYEKTLEIFSEAQGASAYVDKLLDEAETTQNFENLYKELYVPEGCPGYLPFPDFLITNDYEIGYFYVDSETGENILASSGKTVTATPCSVMFNIPGAPKEEIDNYAKVVSNWGLTPIIDDRAEDGSYSLFFTLGNTSVLAKWTAEKITFYIDDEIFFILPEYVISTLNAFS